MDFGLLYKGQLKQNLFKDVQGKNLNFNNK